MFTESLFGWRRIPRFLSGARRNGTNFGALDVSQGATPNGERMRSALDVRIGVDPPLERSVKRRRLLESTAEEWPTGLIADDEKGAAEAAPNEFKSGR
jgi:hypothetical protein